MSYQVLARKWRPRTFSELVGQEHVVRALTNALDQGRLHHAYLFTGTRGVGKTTLARILAKSLNCEQGVSSTPCGTCSICREIDEGRFADLLEVDAASRTRVDETRELLENVPFAPVRGRYKIYLIDEVHMFSNHSFNALLKTLEEPPPHVKFLLATTDPQKLPVTILSRCLQFNLRRLPLQQISGQLQHILDQEGAAYEAPALTLLARAADGSMRDALSLLDQSLAFGDNRVGADDVASLLGDVAGDRLYDLLGALAEADGRQLLEIVAQLAQRAPDYSALLGGLISILHQVALSQVVPDWAADDEQEQAARIRELGERMSPEDVQLYYQIGLIGQRDLPLAPDPRSGLEMVLLRMLAFRPDEASTAPVKKSSAGSRPASTAPAKKPAAHSRPGASSLHRKAPTVPDAAVAAMRSRESLANDRPQPDLSDWDATVKALELGGVARQLVDNCTFAGWDGERLTLQLDPACRHLQVASSEERLAKALQNYLGSPVRLSILTQVSDNETPARRQARELADRQRQAERTMAEDPLVQAMETVFDARLEPGSVRPSKGD